MEILHRKPGRTGYTYWKCRCPACRAWKAAEWARYYRGRKNRNPRPNGWAGYNDRRAGAYE